MGQIVAVGNTKGGVGKTTLAINFAIARARLNRDVLLVDGDEQGTAQSFTQLRAETLGGSPGYTAISLQGVALRTQLRQLKSKYQEIVVDVGGRDTGSLRAALTVAQTLVVPVQPRTFDIWALDSLSVLIDEAKTINPDLAVIVVLNSADPQGSDNDEAAKQISEIPAFSLVRTFIGRRKAFANAAAAGLSVLEYKPRDSKAIEELNACVNAAFEFNNEETEGRADGHREESAQKLRQG
ncbi:MAG: AAA family ATPase [Bryobacteraceae bacterium]